MTAALPSNLHAELALDRGRLSRDGSERSTTRSFAHATAMDQHARVQSLHGVIIETAQFAPSEKHGVIMEEAVSGTLSGADLAAALDQEEGDDDDDEVIRDRSQPAVGQQHDSFPPRQASAGPQQQAHKATYPKSILQNRSTTLTPPPRSSSCSVPSSAPPQQQAFPDRPRFALTDDGPISASPSPHGGESDHGLAGHPATRVAVSDSHPHSHSAPNSPGLAVSPQMHHGGAQTQPSTPRYATFEDMGIQAKGAEKEKDCIIM